MEDNERNNTVRLIVFDEAFSKMDSERIQESVAFKKLLLTGFDFCTT